MGPASGGRNSRGSSAVDEQKRAIQAVMMNMGKNGPGSSASAMAGASRSETAAASSRGGPALMSAKQDREVQKNLLKGSDNLNQNMAEKYSKPLIEEYLNNCDESVSTTQHNNNPPQKNSHSRHMFFFSNDENHL